MDRYYEDYDDFDDDFPLDLGLDDIFQLPPNDSVDPIDQEVILKLIL